MQLSLQLDTLTEYCECDEWVRGDKINAALVVLQGETSMDTQAFLQYEMDKLSGQSSSKLRQRLEEQRSRSDLRAANSSSSFLAYEGELGNENTILNCYCSEKVLCNCTAACTCEVRAPP